MREKTLRQTGEDVSRLLLPFKDVYLSEKCPDVSKYWIGELFSRWLCDTRTKDFFFDKKVLAALLKQVDGSSEGASLYKWKKSETEGGGTSQRKNPRSLFRFPAREKRDQKSHLFCTAYINLTNALYRFSKSGEEGASRTFRQGVEDSFLGSSLLQTVEGASSPPLQPVDEKNRDAVLEYFPLDKVVKDLDKSSENPWATRAILTFLQALTYRNRIPKNPRSLLERMVGLQVK